MLVSLWRRWGKTVVLFFLVNAKTVDKDAPMLLETKVDVSSEGSVRVDDEVLHTGGLIAEPVVPQVTEFRIVNCL